MSDLGESILSFPLLGQVTGPVFLPAVSGGVNYRILLYPVTGDRIASGAVTGSNIASQTITGSNIAPNTITAGLLDPSVLNSFTVGAGSIGTTQLANSSVTTAKIASNAVTGSNIATGTVTGSNIASGTVTGSNIATGTVTGSNIASGTITTSNIATGAVTASNLASNSVGTTAIQAQSVGATQLIDSSITSSKLAPTFYTTLEATLVSSSSFISAVAAASSSTYNPDNYPNVSGLYNCYSYNLPNWRASLQRVKNGALGDSNVVIIGDSIMQGAYSGSLYSQAGTSYASRGNGTRTIEGWLRSKFSAIGISANIDAIFGPFSATTNTATSSTPMDSRINNNSNAWTAYDTAVLGSIRAPGNTPWVNATNQSPVTLNNSNPIIYSPIGTWDTVDMYFLTGNGNITNTYQAGSSTASTGNVVSIPTTTGCIKVTYTAPTNAVQTFKLTCTSGTCVLAGVSFRQSSVGQINFINAASSGSTWDDWLVPYTTGGSNYMNSFINNLSIATTSGGLGINPSLAIIGSMVNDGNTNSGVGDSYSTYLSNLTSIVTTLKNSGSCDVVLISTTGYPTTGNNYSLIMSYRQAMASVSASQGCPFIDLTARWINYNSFTSANIGYVNPTNGHPCGEGYDDISEPIFNLLNI